MLPLTVPLRPPKTPCSSERDTERAVSQENVEIVRRSYAAYNAALDAPNPREAIRVVAESADPQIEWVQDASAPETQTYHGVDGVMEFFDLVFDVFEYMRQVPERFIDCGDRVLVFVRTEARARTTGIETNEPWAHLVTVRDGRFARLQQFRNRADALEAVGLSE
jgi:ketosteroid isomerase-like protein